MEEREKEMEMVTVSKPKINSKEKKAHSCVFIYLIMCVCVCCVYMHLDMSGCVICMFVRMCICNKSSTCTDISLQLTRKSWIPCEFVSVAVIEAGDPMPCIPCGYFGFWLYFQAWTASSLATQPSLRTQIRFRYWCNDLTGQFDN